MTTEAQIEELWRAQERRGVRSRRMESLMVRGVRTLRRAFGLFEGRLAGKVDSDGSTVVVDDQLRGEVLREMMSGLRVCAIHVRQFCPPDIAAQLSEVALSEYTNWKLGGTDTTDMFYAGGSIPREVARRSRKDFFRYIAEWEKFVGGQRAAAGGAWPIDRLRLAMDEAWPHGAHLAKTVSGVRPRPAMMRVMVPDKIETPDDGYVHADDTPFLSRQRGVFSANIYLKMPPGGGELHVWNVNFASARGARARARNRYLSLFAPDVFTMPVQERLRAALPAPLTIRPRTGDLVIIHSGRPHSVAPVREGLRVTNQTFLHYRANRPLAIFS